MHGVMIEINPKMSFEDEVRRGAEVFKKRTGGLRANKCLVSMCRNPMNTVPMVGEIKVEPAIFVLPGVLWVGVEDQ